MDKKIVGIIVFVGLLMVAGGVGAVTLVNPLGSTDTFCKLLINIILVVAGLVAALSTIMITVAGIMFILSAGSPERINKAKTAFFYAIVGFVIAISAKVIVDIIKQVINASGQGCV